MTTLTKSLSGGKEDGKSNAKDPKLNTEISVHEILT